MGAGQSIKSSGQSNKSLGQSNNSSGQSNNSSGQSEKPNNSTNLAKPGSAPVTVANGFPNGNKRSVPAAAPAAGGGKRCWGKKKNMRGGMATVKWDLIPMKQPSQDVMEWATTADRPLLGGRRRSHRHKGHKKSRKVRRHGRSRRHHRKN